MTRLLPAIVVLVALAVGLLSPAQLGSWIQTAAQLFVELLTALRA